MSRTLADALEELIGRQLSSVTFVMDYVQLSFDGPCLTAYTMPTVTSGSQSFSLGYPGYRDALCARIACRVERTLVDDQRVSIIFEGASISVSLRDEDYLGPEALQFCLDEKDCVWVV
jgi:hypothetical protein